MDKMNLCLLVSGKLGLVVLEHIYNMQSVNVNEVLTNKGSDEIITFCNSSGIPCFVGNPRNNKTKDFFINKAKPDILLSVNYLFIIENDLINLPKKYAINIHGSLLPKYRGRTPHVWSIINNEKYTGVTAHLISDVCDQGDILKQIKIPITDMDTGGSILNKYFEIYPVLIDELFNDLKNKKLTQIKQDEKKATYFSKRTPEDGLIDFDWQKERIYNWCRAMCPPEYPGAFYYYNGAKMIVRKCEYSDLGFGLDVKNGTVMETGKDFNIIKTPNGCVKLYSMEV